jgi:hypothetical protein
MIHDASCHIVIEPLKMGVVDIIPTDAEMEEVFKNWRSKYKIFVGRCCQEERLDFNLLSHHDMFRMGMKFAICESRRLM